MSLLETEVSVRGANGRSTLLLTSLDALGILSIDCLRGRYFKDPKAYQWAFGVATMNIEKIKQLFTLPGLSDDPSAVGLLCVKEQYVPTTTMIVHWWQYRTIQNPLFPNHELIHQLEKEKSSARLNHPLIFSYCQCKSLMKGGD